jgi:NADH-quinone oxidoreductase subunit F
VEEALIESSLEERGNPRIKPPFPAVSGLWANPTVVNNVETIASVPWIVNNSGDDYAK